VTSQPTPRGVSPGSSPRVAILPDQIFAELGEYSVGSLGCDDRTVVWTTSSQQRQSHLDLVRAAKRSDHTIRVIARTTKGGTVNDDVLVSGSWAVFMEYQQHDQEFTTDFWLLQAVNLTTGQVVQVGSGTQRPTTLELPFYSVSGHTVVWDELEVTGRKVMRIRDLNSASEKILSLPSTMYPTRPKISGDHIVFLDNSTDPGRTTEDFYTRTGKLMLYDLSSGRLKELSSTPQAAQPDYHGGMVVWSGASQDPRGASGSFVPDVRLSPLDGKPFRIIGGLGDLPLISDSFAIWYDHEQRRLFAYSLGKQQTTILTVTNHTDLKAEYALCGSTLFYALPPDVDGNASRLRYLDLQAAFN
jgi:hypothetical protein